MNEVFGGGMSILFKGYYNNGFSAVVFVSIEYKEMLSMVVMSVCLVAAFMLFVNIVTNKRVDVL